MSLVRGSSLEKHELKSQGDRGELKEGRTETGSNLAKEDGKAAYIQIDSFSSSARTKTALFSHKFAQCKFSIVIYHPWKSKRAAFNRNVMTSKPEASRTQHLSRLVLMLPFPMSNSHWRRGRFKCNNNMRIYHNYRVLSAQPELLLGRRRRALTSSHKLAELISPVVNLHQFLLVALQIAYKTWPRRHFRGNLGLRVVRNEKATVSRITKTLKKNRGSKLKKVDE